MYHRLGPALNSADALRKIFELCHRMQPTQTKGYCIVNTPHGFPLLPHALRSISLNRHCYKYIILVSLN